MGAALWQSCGGGGGGDIVEPTTGAVEVTTSTTGAEPDPDGYTLTLDDAEIRPIGTAASAVLTDLSPGEHRIGLAGIAPNCTVQGGNPRAVTVTAGETTAEDIVVLCEAAPPATGGVNVSVATSGSSPDPDGYSVTVDGDAGRPIAANGTVAVPDLAVGSHLVGLAGVAANCTVEGDNPRSVEVIAGSVVPVDFSIECGTIPTGAGTVTVTTVTSGAGGDPDGYDVRIGDGAVQPIGANATVSVANVTPGATTVELSGVAPNCDVGGQNPRTVTVPAGGAVSVSFAITCATGTGTLEIRTVSTGGPADPSGYTVSVDAGAPVAIGVNATRTIDGLSPGSHEVSLAGLAANCAVEGSNPVSVTITAGETAELEFAVQCSPTTGSLRVVVTGLPTGVDALVTVTGPGSFNEEVAATRTLDDLAPGEYTVSAANVSSGGATYSASPADRSVTVAAGATAQVTVTYASTGGPTLNLRIAGLNLTQSVQTFGNEIPLVAGRDAFLRVYAQASRSNSVGAPVRVRLYDGSTLVQTFTIPSPADSVPTGRSDDDLSTTWNLLVPGSLVRPGLGIRADVDPANAVAETNEADNLFPATGPQLAVQVRQASPLAITLIPVRQSANGLQGDVTDANRDEYLDLARRMYPLPGYNAQVREAYTTTTLDALQSGNENGAWNTILSEVFALRVADESDRHYYGVVRVGYTSGLAGLGFIGHPVALGYDRPDDRARIAAHELGHTWGRQHAPCGNPPSPDLQFPHPGGTIGTIGYDVEEEAIKPESTPDVMGYCGNPWISHYTYGGVMGFRQSAGGGTSGGRAQPTLLVWGRIVDGRAVLEPAFHIITRPVLPGRPGPYSIEGTAADGSRVFDLSFEAIEVADDERGARHFAFAVPLDRAAVTRLETIRLAGPGIGMAAVVRSPAALRAAPAMRPSVTRAANGVAVRWDAAAHPMVMVRDAGSGRVLSFARGGQVVVPAGPSGVDLVMSDGVGSHLERIPAPR
jgi:hypothetical protein